MTADNVSSVSIAHRFFLEELVAFRDARRQPDTLVVLRPATHAVGWACTLDDLLMKESFETTYGSDPKEQEPSKAPRWSLRKLLGCQPRRKRPRRKQTPYELTRDAHKDGRCMLGVRYIRNRLTHQFMDVLEDKPGAAALPIEFGAGVFHEFVWLPLPALPKPDPRFDRAEERRSYENELAEKVVRFTLGRLQEFFAEAVHGQFAGQVPREET